MDHIRHDCLPVRIAEGDESEFGCGIDNQVFREFAQMNHAKTRPHQELGDEVSIGDAPHAVLCHRLKAEFFGQEVPVDQEGVPGKRS